MPDDRLIILKDGQFVLRQYNDIALGDQQEVIDQLCGNIGDSHCGRPTGTVSVELSPNGYLMGEKVSNVSCKFWNGVISTNGKTQKRYVAVEVPFFPLHCYWGRIDVSANGIEQGLGLTTTPRPGVERSQAEIEMHEKIVEKGIWLPGLSLNRDGAKEWIVRRTLGGAGRDHLKDMEIACILLPTPGRTIISASYAHCGNEDAHRGTGTNASSERYRIGSFMNLGSNFVMDQSRCAFNKKALPLDERELKSRDETRKIYHDRFGSVYAYAPPFPNINNEGSLCLGDEHASIARMIRRGDGSEQDIAQELLRVFMNSPCSNHWASPATNKICALDIDKMPVRASLTTDYFFEYANSSDRALTNPETLAQVLGRKV